MKLAGQRTPSPKGVSGTCEGEAIYRPLPQLLSRKRARGVNGYTKTYSELV